MPQKKYKILIKLRVAKSLLNFFIILNLLVSCNRRLLVSKNQFLYKQSGLLVFNEKSIEFINEFGILETRQSDSLVKDFFVPVKLENGKIKNKNYLYDLLFDSEIRKSNEVIFETEDISNIENLNKMCRRYYFFKEDTRH
jgi:hypothetical protein